MSKITVLSLLAVCLVDPLAARAAGVYVPSPPLSESAAAELQTEISMRNLSSGKTSLLRESAGSSGLRRLSADANVVYEARVVNREEAVVELPVITADNLARGGQTVALDLFAADTVAANVALVNLGNAGNRCTLALTSPDGLRLKPLLTLTLDALETRSFLDVFAEVTRSFGATEASATITCAQDFYAFALLADQVRGGLELVRPIEAESSLALAAPVEECPELASCFDAPGIYFIPQPPPAKSVGRARFPAPAGEVNRLRLSLNLKVGEWFPEEPSGKHLAYWFVINQNPDMPGMLYLRGPGKTQAFVVHGLRLKHGQKKRIIKPFEAKIGTTYHIVNDYDLANGTYTVTISDAKTGEVGIVLHGRPNLESFTIRRRSSFIIDMGFPPHYVPHEVPSYGWEYSDIHLEAFMK